MRAFLGGVMLLGGILGLGYGVQQDQFPLIISLFALAFIGYVILLFERKVSLKSLLVFAVLIRLVLLFSFPLLSDDIYRFFWDGILLSNGFNPYAYLPAGSLDLVPGLIQELFEALNSPDYYTVYPPISQFVYALVAWISPNSISLAAVIMKLILLGAEIGVMFIMYRLLIFYKQDVDNILFYALNPLVIVEILGNVHFEGLMLFFLMFSIYVLVRKSSFYWIALAGILMAISIGVKLHTAMLIPVLMVALGIKKIVPFSVGLIVALSLMLLPFISLDSVVSLGSLDLYFRNFEFNASLYYLARWVGFQYSGYNLIYYIGPSLGLIGLISILFISIWVCRKAYRHEISIDHPHLLVYMLACFVIFLLMSTTVHPWYLIVPLGISVFTKKRFVMIWSLLIVLSYSHYWGGGNAENYGFITLEYLLVILVLIYEIKPFLTK